MSTEDKGGVVTLQWSVKPLPVKLFPQAKREVSPANWVVLWAKPLTILHLLLSVFSSQPLCSCPNKPFQFRLVDSGVDDNFNDSNLVLQVEIPTEEITPPRGYSWWKIATLHYSPYCSHHLISGNHRETIELLVISSPNSPVYLSLPLLKLNNPHIGWLTGSIISWSIFCHSHCLKSAVTLVALSLLTTRATRFVLCSVRVSWFSQRFW